MFEKEREELEKRRAAPGNGFSGGKNGKIEKSAL
jgi:hypothetical protein